MESDAARLAGAGIEQDTGFAAKPQLAQRMIGRAAAAGLPFAWFTADEAYGGNGPLRGWLEENKLAYVVAISCDHRIPAGAGRVIRADALAAAIGSGGWQRMPAGPGSKGERDYDWALAGAGPGHQMLIRRSVTSGELAFCLCWSPRHAALAELAPVAGARWAVEECFQAAKNETALDPLPGPQAHQLAPARHAGHVRPRLARRHRGPATAASPERGHPACGQLPAPPTRPRDHQATHSDPAQHLVPLSVNEIRRLHAIFTRPGHDPAHHWHWSHWRRRHQARVELYR